MTPTLQPKALELAASAHLGYRVGWQREAAAELRRQHAEIADLREQLERKSAAIQRLWAERDSLRAEVERLRADAERLDWLDEQNARKNSANGTTYGWSFNENCNRIALEDHAWPHVNVRAAIDAAREAKG